MNDPKENNFVWNEKKNENSIQTIIIFYLAKTNNYKIKNIKKMANKKLQFYNLRKHLYYKIQFMTMTFIKYSSKFMQIKIPCKRSAIKANREMN